MEPAGPAPPDASAAPLWEPILCSEAENGHAPLSLDLLFHAAQVSCPNDAVVVAAHTLLLEAGFTPQVSGRGLVGPRGPALTCAVFRAAS